MKRSTIKDIAIIAGVSTSTVSRALHDHPDLRPEVISKIKEIANQLKYIPNPNALNLKNHQSKSIGLIVPDISMFYIPNVMAEITNTMNSLSYKVLILSSNENTLKEAENVTMCCNQNVDGIIMSLCSSTHNYEHLLLAHELGIPLVLFDKTINSDFFDEIKINDRNAALECMAYLYENNCKNIICLFGDENLGITQQRKKGVEEFLQMQPKIQCHFVYAKDSFESQQLCNMLLDNHKNIDGIFAMSDEVLLGLNKTLFKNKLSVKLVAISEGVLPQFLPYPIVYFEQDSKAMARKAIEVLIRKIASTQTNTEVERIYIDLVKKEIK